MNTYIATQISDDETSYNLIDGEKNKYRQNEIERGKKRDNTFLKQVNFQSILHFGCLSVFREFGQHLIFFVVSVGISMVHIMVVCEMLLLLLLYFVYWMKQVELFEEIEEKERQNS